MKRDCRVDLLVTDVRMPGDLDGLALASWTRQNCWDAKIVVITGYAGEQGLEGAQDFDAFVRKPFDGRYLLETAENLLGSA